MYSLLFLNIPEFEFILTVQKYKIIFILHFNHFSLKLSFKLNFHSQFNVKIINRNTTLVLHLIRPHRKSEHLRIINYHIIRNHNSSKLKEKGFTMLLNIKFHLSQHFIIFVLLEIKNIGFSNIVTFHQVKNLLHFFRIQKWRNIQRILIHN